MTTSSNPTRLPILALTVLTTSTFTACNNFNFQTEPADQSDVRHFVRRSTTNFEGSKPKAEKKTAKSAVGAADKIVDAMVGQINGTPVYASQVIKRIGEQSVTELGRTRSRLGFKAEMTQIVTQTLRAQVINGLVLAQATRDLTEQQHFVIKTLLEKYRERLIAEVGQGSAAIAEKKLREDGLKGLEDAVERQRRRILVRKYTQDKIYPKIHISKRDVERYYRDHPEEFSEKTQVTVRMILVRGKRLADMVDKALAAGKPFKNVAASYSAYKKSQGGLYGTIKMDKPLSEFDALNWPELNEATRSLTEGKHTPRTAIKNNPNFDFGWIYIEKLIGGKKQTLADVFLSLERKLRAMEFNRESNKYQIELLSKNNYTDIRVMTDRVIDVAMTLYAKPT